MTKADTNGAQHDRSKSCFEIQERSPAGPARDGVRAVGEKIIISNKETEFNKTQGMKTSNRHNFKPSVSDIPHVVEEVVASDTVTAIDMLNDPAPNARIPEEQQTEEKLLAQMSGN